MQEPHDLILLVEYQNTGFSPQPTLQPNTFYDLCLSWNEKYPTSLCTHSRHPCHNICTPSCACRLLSEPANVHVANMRTHQSTETSTAKPWPCFFSLAVSALRESKRRHKALSVSAVCLDLTLVYVHVCAWVHVCVCICVANHIKERQSGSVVMTSDPGMLRDRGRVVEEEKKTQSNIATHTHTHKEKGGIHSTASKFTTARKTTTDRDIAICLVNFYRDLWVSTHK